MKKFRLPRKIKKVVKKGMVYFYPMDEKEKTFLMAWPAENQKDYDAYKSGVVKSFFKNF
jgi:predicted YcjX-like family ATPase